MTTRETLSHDHGIFLSDDMTIICAASVLWSALKANAYVDVLILNRAFMDADLDDVEGAGDAVKGFLKALSDMPTPPEDIVNEGVPEDEGGS